MTWSAKGLYSIEMEEKMMDNSKDHDELSKDHVIKFEDKGGYKLI